MPNAGVAIVNAGSVLPDAEVAAMVPALQSQVSGHLAPVWGVDATPRGLSRPYRWGLSHAVKHWRITCRLQYSRRARTGKRLSRGFANMLPEVTRFQQVAQLVERDGVRIIGNDEVPRTKWPQSWRKSLYR